MTRLYYKGSSCATNYINNADISFAADKLKVKKAVKVSVWGPAGIQPKEQAKSDDDEVILNHHGKNVKLSRELWHHRGFASLTLASPGDGTAIWAGFLAGLKILVFYRNDAHKELLESDLHQNIVGEASSNAEFFGYLSRAWIIERLGLEPDAVTPEEIASEDAAPLVPASAAAEGGAPIQDAFGDTAAQAAQAAEPPTETSSDVVVDMAGAFDDSALFGSGDGAGGPRPKRRRHRRTPVAQVSAIAADSGH